MRNSKKKPFETKPSPVAFISDFQNIITWENLHYLKTKHKLQNTIYRQIIAKTET